MSSQVQPITLTVDEYLKLELESEIRHEYIAGEIYAMTGSSEEHNIIAGNFYTRLRTHLRNSGCKVFVSDMKSRIEALDIFYYPDVFVTCDPQDRERYFKKNPCLIIEVLSPTTTRIDRNEKRLNYRELTSLQEYILVSQDQIRVEIYRKDSQGNWQREILGQGDTLNLTSVGLEMTMAEIYEDIEF